MYNHITISIQEWNKQKQEINNVGSFGYDEGSDFFIVPYVPAGTFISNPVGNITVGTEQMTPKQGDYVKDQIVNIRGSTTFSYILREPPAFKDSGALFSQDISYRTPGADGGRMPDTKGIKINFDASRSTGINTGDRVMPRTIFQNLYVIVSEE